MRLRLEIFFLSKCGCEVALNLATMDVFTGGHQIFSFTWSNLPKPEYRKGKILACCVSDGLSHMMLEIESSDALRLSIRLVSLKKKQPMLLFLQWSDAHGKQEKKKGSWLRHMGAASLWDSGAASCSLGFSVLLFEQKWLNHCGCVSLIRRQWGSWNCLYSACACVACKLFIYIVQRMDLQPKDSSDQIERNKGNSRCCAYTVGSIAALVWPWAQATDYIGFQVSSVCL